MSWAVEATEEFIAWYESLEKRQREAIGAALQVLAEQGPALGRPLVDTLAHTRVRRLKELRPPGGNIRILFAFDSRRTAVLLVGGDKTGRWQAWYDEMIPVAERLFEQHLKSLP